MVQVINLKEENVITVLFYKVKPDFISEIKIIGDIKIVEKINFILPEEVKELIYAIQNKPYLFISTFISHSSTNNLI